MTFTLFLGSGSPRRLELLRQMDIPFIQRILDVDESYPMELEGAQITDFLAKLKGKAYQPILKPNELVLTADTIVWHNGKALGKPRSHQEAVAMLSALSGCTHQVISSVCLSSSTSQNWINETTKVTFATLSNQDIETYVETYKPFDKAGAYGIQEWIGHIGVSKIEGSYANVVGLPTQKTYELLKPYFPFDNV